MSLHYFLFPGFFFALLPLWAHGDSLEAYVALRQGDHCIESEDFGAAEAYYRQALPFFLNKGRHYEQAYIYLWLSEASYYLYGYKRAMKEAKASLRIAEKYLYTDTLSFYSTILQNIGLFYSRAGDYDAQMFYYKSSLKAALSCRGFYSRQASDAYFSVGAAFGRRGRWGQFIAYSDTALQIAEAIGYQGGIASALLNLSYGFAEKEDYDKAIRYQQRALALTGSQSERARGLNNLGSLYIDTGEYGKALEKLGEALVMRQKQKDSNYFSTLLNMARAHSESGETEKAALYLDEVIAGLSKGRESEAVMLQIALNYKARLLARTGRAAQAEPLARQALELKCGRPDVNASSCMVKGEVHLALRQYKEALDAVQEAWLYQAPDFEPAGIFASPPWQNLESVSLGRAMLRLKGDILREWGLAEGKKSLLDASLETFRRGDSLITWSRYSYQNRASRDLLAANANELYAGALHTLFHLYEQTADTAYFNLALAYVEQNKALSVLENLNELYARSFLGIPDAVVKAEQSLVEDIDFYTRQLKLSRGEADKEMLGRWEESLFLKRRAQDSLLKDIRLRHPRYYNMRHGRQEVSPGRLRSELLAEGETLVEYFLDGDSVFVLLLSAGQQHFYRLPAPDLAEQVALLREAAIQRSDTFYALSHSLYRTLVLPLADDISGGRLAIVPDGVLAYLPFELLLSEPPPPPDQVRHASMPYLLRAYSIRYLFSAGSALQYRLLQGEQRAGRRGILALAPIFGPNGAGSGHFTALPGAQAELDSLETGFMGWFFRGKRATESNFKRFSQYADVYHIATHADVNDLLPGASRLLLQPGSGEDGELFAYELYKLRLPAGLAVLSACNTGIGKIKKGEGSASLAHAFAYAGCPNLVMSLWPVRDRATPLLIKQYYDRLAEGMDKAEALRAAKLYCLEHDELFAHPYFWGGFLYAGSREPQPLKRRWSPGAGAVAAASAFALLVLALIVFLRRSGPVWRSGPGRISVR